MTTTLKQVLTIAGSDSGGGAGIQADIKAMSANGVFAMSVITAITAQNTEEVTDVFEIPTSVIAAQIDAVFDDFDVAAVKTGMLSSAGIVETVAKMLKPQEVANLVVDPVMISKSGHSLLQPDAIEAVKKQLLPLALLVTPNVHEAQQLSGIKISSLADARRAAKVIHGFGCKLHLSALLVDADPAADQHVQSVFRAEAEQHRLTAEENHRKLRFSVLQREIKVSGGRRPAIGNLTFGPHVWKFPFNKIARPGNQVAHRPDAACRLRLVKHEIELWCGGV